MESMSYADVLYRFIKVLIIPPSCFSMYSADYMLSEIWLDSSWSFCNDTKKRWKHPYLFSTH